MTTLQKLSSQVIRLLSAGAKTKDSNLNQDYIIAELRQLCNKKIRAEFYSSLNAGDRDVNHLCIATYEDIEVLFDEGRQRCYIDMPVFPESLPGSLGIQEIRPQTGDPSIDVAMIPIMPHELELFRSLNVGLEVMRDQYCWEPDRGKTWFTDANNESLIEAGITEVEMKCVVIDPAQIGDTDNLPISPGYEIDIITECLQLHGYSTREATDLVNDNAPQK